MKLLLTLSLLVATLTTQAQTDSITTWISKIDNNQLYGTCHYFWTLEVSRDAKEVSKLINAGKPATNRLIEHLTDSTKEIICHYILSTVYDALTISTIFMGDNTIKYVVNNLEFTYSPYRYTTSPARLKETEFRWRTFLQTQ